MPALGMAQDTGIIVCWRKEVGDQVAIGDPLFDVETDKTTMEVEAAHEGFLAEIRVETGTDVPIGETIAIITKAAPSRAGSELAPEVAKAQAPKPLAQPTPRDKPAAPTTPSTAPTILASPKAKFEAHRRGIDLKQLVEQGLPQPYHVSDLNRLKPETGTAGPLPQVSVLTANFAWSAFDDFIAWAEMKTGKEGMRQATLAAFAVSAFRAEVRLGKADGLTISVMSAKSKASEATLRDPDLQGLGDLVENTADRSSANADLTLIDLSGTRLAEYRPPILLGQSLLVIADKGPSEAVANLHFCEDDLSLLAAARFLDNFASRTAEPILQLL